MPYLLFAHPQQREEINQSNYHIYSRIDGKLKHCKQINNLMPSAFDVNIATLIIIITGKERKKKKTNIFQLFI